MKRKEKKNSDSLKTGMGFGVALGVAIGLLMDNLPMGIAVGLALGAGTGYSGLFNRKKSGSEKDGNTRNSEENS